MASVISVAIYLLVYQTGQIGTVRSIEFTDQASCESFKSQMDSGFNVKTSCIPYQKPVTGPHQ